MSKSPLARRVVLATAFLFAGCAALKKTVRKPTVSYASMSVRSITFSDATVDVYFTVNNPNIFSIPVKKYDYTFKIGDYPLASGAENAASEVPAQGTARLTVPVTVRYDDLADAVGLLKDSDRWPYSVSGSVTIDVGPLSGITIPFSHRDTLPRPLPPTMRIARLNVRSFGFAGIDMDVVLSFRNRGRLPYTLNDLAGTVALNGRRFFSIDHLREAVRLPAGEERTVTLPVRLSGLSMVRALQSILSEGRAEYRLVGETSVQTDSFGALPLKLDETGTVRLFR